MRVVMFSTSFPPEIGGIQQHVVNLSQALVGRGHQVSVVTVKRNSTEPVKETVGGLEVTRIPQLRIPKTTTAQYLSLAACSVIRKRWRGQADVVHYHTFWPDAFTAFAVNKVAPTMYTVHESRFLLMAEQAKLQRRLRLALKPFQGIIAPSTELLTAARDLGAAAERSVFIPNAVDAGRFSPKVPRGKVRTEFRLTEEDTLILCPRRLVPKNGINFLIESMALLRRQSKGVSLLIVGDGPERQALEDQCRALEVSDSVIFAGSRSNEELPQFYADADIVAIPSLKEATSIAGLEAMASARAVIATNVGGLPEIITDEVTGLLVPPRSPQALAGALKRLITQSDLRERLGYAARLRVETEFNWESVARKTEHAYERAIAIWQGKTAPGLAHA